MKDSQRPTHYTKGVYVVFDRIAQEPVSISISNNDAQAFRAYSHGMQNVPNLSDYQLHCVGFIDMDSAILYPLVPTKVVIGSVNASIETEATPIGDRK